MTVQLAQKKTVGGAITVPGDKSISHRVVILGSIAMGVTEVRGFLRGQDTLTTMECFKQMGVEFEYDAENDILRINGVGLRGLKAPKAVLNCGNSGTTMRLLCGLLAGQSFKSELDGDESLRKRPMERVLQPLREMGAKIESNDGFAPLKIKGRPIAGINYTMKVYSAQVKSAILLADLYSLTETKVTELVTGLTRNHTENMLETMRNVSGNLVGRTIKVPGDLSSAAPFLILGLLLAENGLTIKNVGVNPTRAGVLTALREMGGDVQVHYSNFSGGEPVADIIVRKSPLKGITLEGNAIPLTIDEIPILTVAALFAEGATTIKDAEELTLKETDRLKVMAKELSKMGAHITADKQGMVIQGGIPIKAAKLDSHGDHRIAMSLAIAASLATGKSTLDNAHWTDVSFPGFFEILQSI